MNDDLHMVKGTPYCISDVNGYRHLLVTGDIESPVSRMRIDAPDALVAPYTAAMLMLLPLMAPVRDIVLIGLGGGQQAKFIHNRLPDARLAAVEPDPAMVSVARTYFGVPPDDARLSVVVGNGRDYVLAHPNSCDLILADGYDNTHTIDGRLANEEFYRACHRALRRGGMLAINIHELPAAWRAAHLDMLRDLFRFDAQLDVAAEHSVLLLAKEPPRAHTRILLARAEQLEARLHLNLPAFIRRYGSERFTDDGFERTSLVFRDLHFGNGTGADAALQA